MNDMYPNKLLMYSLLPLLMTTVGSPTYAAHKSGTSVKTEILSELSELKTKKHPAKKTTLNVAPTLGVQNIKEHDRVKAPEPLKRINSFERKSFELSSSSEAPVIFDLPVTYNSRVKYWIKYFQTTGRKTFRNWLERSSRYMPWIQNELQKAGLPRDLAYIPMIESGFSPQAVSPASAVGMWQFIAPTGSRYGLRIEWWLDERRDIQKSTRAAIGYLRDLYKIFGSWYLVAAGYNMGENGVARLAKKHNTNNFWALADAGALNNETKNYVPKIIAAMLISKAPALYGFRGLQPHLPLEFEYFNVPGGTDLINLARFLSVSEKYLKELNPELIRGFIPRDIASHRIRIPKGSMMMVSQYVRMQLDDTTISN